MSFTDAAKIVMYRERTAVIDRRISDINESLLRAIK